MMSSPGDGPLVSVVVPSYDRPEFLRSAVESVLRQTYEPVEVIVVDDASAEPGTDALDGVSADSVRRLEVIRHDENRGGAAARNTGIDHSDGDLIAFLDDDDLFLGEKIRRQVAAIQSVEDERAVAYSGSYLLKRDRVSVSHPPDHQPDDLTKELLLNNVVGSFSNVLVTRDAVEAVGPLDESFPSLQDTEWYVRLSRECRFCPVDEPLAVRRIKRSHDRLGLDRETTMEVAYPLFLEKFESTAAEYGEAFRREFCGRIHYRIGRYYLAGEQYGPARRHLLRAAVAYPWSSDHLKYAAVGLGGPLTYRLASTLVGGAGGRTGAATPSEMTLTELAEKHQVVADLLD